MKKAIPIIIILLIFTIGLGILTYPLISSVANNIEMRSHAAAYFDDAKKEDPEDIKAMFAEAEEYNQSLLNMYKKMNFQPLSPMAEELFHTHYVDRSVL